MGIAFYGTNIVIVGMVLLIIHLYNCRKISRAYTRSVVIVIGMIGSLYVGMIMQVVLLSVLHSMIIGVLAGVLFVIGMGRHDMDGFLHGLMQSLMGGMMGGMLSGMVAVENWEMMIQVFSLLVFSILLLTVYVFGQDHLIVTWIKSPMYMALSLTIFGLLLYQIELSPTSDHSPHLHESFTIFIETYLS